jgi:hypothetical protein
MIRRRVGRPRVGVLSNDLAVAHGSLDLDRTVLRSVDRKPGFRLG